MLAEGTINESMVTELYERSKWKHSTIHDEDSFEMPFPFFSVCGALHVPDVASLFWDGDSLGLRGRTTFFYSRPAFHKAAVIREANEAVNQRLNLKPLAPQ